MQRSAGKQKSSDVRSVGFLVARCNRLRLALASILINSPQLATEFQILMKKGIGRKFAEMQSGSKLEFFCFCSWRTIGLSLITAIDSSMRWNTYADSGVKLLALRGSCLPGNRSTAPKLLAEVFVIFGQKISSWGASLWSGNSAEN